MLSWNVAWNVYHVNATKSKFRLYGCEPFACLLAKTCGVPCRVRPDLSQQWLLTIAMSIVDFVCLSALTCNGIHKKLEFHRAHTLRVLWALSVAYFNCWCFKVMEYHTHGHVAHIWLNRFCEQLVNNCSMVLTDLDILRQDFISIWATK